jgi:hypothetical protein
MRKRFDKSDAIDAANNLRLVSMIRNHNGSYSEEEKEIFRKGMARLELFKGGSSSVTVKKVKAQARFVKTEIAFEEGDPLGWGRSETLVRASKEQVREHPTLTSKEAAPNLLASLARRSSRTCGTWRRGAGGLPRTLSARCWRGRTTTT